MLARRNEIRRVRRASPREIQLVKVRPFAIRGDRAGRRREALERASSEEAPLLRGA